MLTATVAQRIEHPASTRIVGGSSPPSRTNEQLWVLVKHYERLIALLLEQLDDDKRIDSGQR